MLMAAWVASLPSPSEMRILTTAQTPALTILLTELMNSATGRCLRLGRAQTIAAPSLPLAGGLAGEGGGGAASSAS